MAARLAFISAVLGVSIQLGLMLIGGLAFPGYSHAAQFISELGAQGAPHADIVSLAGFLPTGLLICSFAWFAWKSLPRSRAVTLGLAGIALFGSSYVVSALFPCDAGCRPDNPSMAQVIHNVVGLLGYIAMPPSLLALGRQARGWTKGLPLAVLGLVAAGTAFAGLVFLFSTDRYAGAAQRIIEGSVIAWVLACAFYLLGSRARKG